MARIAATMGPHGDLLTLSAAALAVAAVSLTGFGLRRERYRGWRWWAAALWLATAGALLGALGRGALAEGLAGLLLMQWPVLTLVGLRLFHARQALPGRAATDWTLLGVAAALMLVAALAGHALPLNVVVAVCGLALHLYAAVLLMRGQGGHDGVPLQALGVTLALVALGPVFAQMPSGAILPPLSARAFAAALGAVVTAFVVLMLVCERSERQLRDSRRRLRGLANMDALTQVPNRRHFHDLAGLALHQDPPASAALLMLDIDHFKQINDHLGHAAGDRALTVVSTSILEHLRSQDLAGRLGGDEFALLLRRADTAAAMTVAARIVAEVQRRSLDARLPQLTLSFGMVQLREAERLDDALRRADQAMYEAKRQGRSRAVAAAGDEDHPVFSESQRLGLTPA